MLRKSTFFDFLNRREERDFGRFISNSVEDEDYIAWNGFALPCDYGDAESEYLAIRNSCAVFDVSPMQKIRIRGVESGDFLDRLLTRPVSDFPARTGTYTVFCNEDGNLKDDAILYKFTDEDYLMMPSDIDHSPYFESVCRRFELYDVSFTECTDAWAGLAVQGPDAASVLLKMGFDGAENLRPFEFREFEIGEGKLTIARMGFTADLGYECWFDPDLADLFVKLIQSARSAMNIAIPGYGLSALEACRLEGGFIVAGWDCSTEVDPAPGFERSPFELGLAWLVNLDGAPFIGRDALLAQKENGPPFTLRSFEIETDRTPGEGATLLAEASGKGHRIGSVNCSSWSWGLKKVIGNASVKSEYADRRNAWVAIDGKHVEVKLSRGPLVTLDRRSKVPAPGR